MAVGGQQRMAGAVVAVWPVAGVSQGMGAQAVVVV